MCSTHRPQTPSPDYKRTLKKTTPDDPEYETLKRACHLRSAQRLVALCFANGGIYIKLGQHIGQLDHLLPDEYVHTMRTHLLDQCPVSDQQEVGGGVVDSMSLGDDV